MSDTSTATEGQAPDGAQQQQGGDAGQGPEPSRAEPWNDPAAAEATIRKLRDENSRYRTERKELEPLARRARELEDQGKTEVEKLSGKLQESDRTAAEAQQEALRLRVALRQGLTETQARRLVGTTEAELEADAKDLLSSFGQQSPAGPRRRPSERLAGGASGSEGPVPDDMTQRIRRASGRT